MIKSFKVRLYPTKEQEQLMWKHIGCCRYIWNYMITVQEDAYKTGRKHLSAFDMINLISPLKSNEEYAWLKDVSNISLCNICRDLDESYSLFFNKNGKLPHLKTKKCGKQSFPARADRLYFVSNKFVHIEKIGKVKYKTDFVLEMGRSVKITNPRISNVNDKWILSFGMECENQVHVLNDYNVGIDLGIKDSAIVACGDKKLVFQNINKSKKVKFINERIKHLQRSISRKYKANKQGKKYIKTKNIEREEQQLRKLCARISNIRNNYIHQSTHSIISLLPKRVVMEDLNVQGMMKNKHLARAVQEQCFYEWRRQMQYKCEWNGIEFVLADRFYPSSKTCHNCGCIKRNLKLSDRTFVCDECGYVEDRDYNAALNLMSYGD